MKTVLWVDDDHSALTGLSAYLEEISELRLLVADSVDNALIKLGENEVNLVIFDMVLMDDSAHASLQRDSGIYLAEQAIRNGIREFVSYTVLTEGEVRSSWKRVRENHYLEDIRWEYFPKDAPVKQIVHCIAEMLGVE